MRKRYRASNKVKRDGWVKQMAEDMPQLTQKEIAQRFGLEQSTVSRILGLAKLPGKDWCWHKDKYPDGLVHVCTKQKGHSGQHDYLVEEKVER